jgi:hypothetical protein
MQKGPLHLATLKCPRMESNHGPPGFDRLLYQLSYKGRWLYGVGVYSDASFLSRAVRPYHTHLEIGFARTVSLTLPEQRPPHSTVCYNDMFEVKLLNLSMTSASGIGSGLASISCDLRIASRNCSISGTRVPVEGGFTCPPRCTTCLNQNRLGRWYPSNEP